MIWSFTSFVVGILALSPLAASIEYRWQQEQPQNDRRIVTVATVKPISAPSKHPTVVVQPSIRPFSKPTLPPRPTPQPTGVGRLVSIGTITIPAKYSYGDFQAGLSSNGTVLVVAVRPYSSDTLPAVFVYRPKNNAVASTSPWELTGSFTEGIKTTDILKGTFALSGDGRVLAFGVQGSPRGYVMVYHCRSNQWVPLGVTKGYTIAGVLKVEAIGSLALSYGGATLAVGTAGRSGQIAVFRWNGADWQPRSSPIRSGSNLFSMSADGNVISVLVNSTIQMFRYNASATGSWSPFGKGVPLDAGYGFLGSLSLSADGRHVAVGLSTSANVSTYTAARVYQYSALRNQWVAVGKGLVVPNRYGNLGNGLYVPYVGQYVSLSGDGSVLAVASGLGQLMSAGEGRLYKVTNNTWIQIGNIFGAPTISLSANGKVFVVPGGKFSVNEIVI